MSDRPRPWQELPPADSKIPGLLSDEERRYLTWVTAETYDGLGAVVELGCWLGASTAALAEGLRRRGSQGKVHSRDLFRWISPEMDVTSGQRLPDGADFQPLFHRMTRHYADWIQAEQMDLNQASWTGGPIEILFVDAGKSWQHLNAVLSAFAPSLIVGKSRVILQDFRHFCAYCLPLTFDGRPDTWEEVEAVDCGTSVTFRPLRPWGEVAEVYGEHSFDFDAARAIFERRIHAADLVNRGHYQAGLYVKALLDGAWEWADALESDMLAAGVTPALELLPGAARLVHDRSASARDLARSESLRRRLDRLQRQADDIASRGRRAKALIGQARDSLRDSAFERANEQALAALELLEPHDRIARDALSLLEQAWAAEQDERRPGPILERLAAKYADRSDFLVLKAVVLAHTGRRAAARVALERAADLEPDHPDAARLLAAWFGDETELPHSLPSAPRPDDGG